MLSIPARSARAFSSHLKRPAFPLAGKRATVISRCAISALHSIKEHSLNLAK